MVDIMKKVSDLYDTLLVKDTEQRAEKEALDERAAVLFEAENSLESREIDLAAKGKKVKRVADIGLAEANLAARNAELSIHEEDLVERQDAFEAEMALKRADLDKRDKESQDMADDTLATRERVQVVLKDTEARKKKYKEEVLKELGKK